MFNILDTKNVRPRPNWIRHKIEAIFNENLSIFLLSSNIKFEICMPFRNEWTCYAIKFFTSYVMHSLTTNIIIPKRVSNLNGILRRNYCKPSTIKAKLVWKIAWHRKYMPYSGRFASFTRFPPIDEHCCSIIDVEEVANYRIHGVHQRLQVLQC